MNDSSHFTAEPTTNPLLGLVAVAVCAPLAVLSVPYDHRPAGALFVPALLLTFGLLATPIMTAYRAPAAIFRVENLIMLGLAYWLLIELLQAAYDLEGVGRVAVQSCFAAIGLFASGVWLAGMHLPWRLPVWVTGVARTEWREGALFGAVLVCAGIALFRFAWPCGFDPVLMIASLAGNRWSAPWSRGALGGADAFVDHLVYFGYLLPVLTVLLAHRCRGWIKPTVVASILLTVLVTAFVAHGGGRRIVGVMFGAAIICWVLLRGRAAKLTTFIMPAVGIAALLLFMHLLLEYRSVGYGKLLEGEQLENRSRYLHVDDNFLRLAQVIELVPDRHPHTYEKVFVWVAIRPIPRLFWPGKPLDPGFDLAQALGSKGVSLSSSVVGELYVSFGWPTILLGGWLFGRLAGMCNQFLTSGSSPVRILMYALGAMAIFAGLRSLVELVLMSYVVLAWIALIVFYRQFTFLHRRSDSG